jgi:flavin reductase
MLDHSTELRARFVDAMSKSVAGVTVVTSAGQSGRFGQTVSSMCSVSADPPLLLVCLHEKSLLSKAIPRHGLFSVNVLRADQRRVADVFAGRPRSGQPYDFDCAVWEESERGSPLLVGAVARFDCELESSQKMGTHWIFIGRVISAHAGTGTPLAYGQRGYGEMLSFPRHLPDDKEPPAGFVGDEPDNEVRDLWDREDWQ